jgi:endoglucanase
MLGSMALLNPPLSVRGVQIVDAAGKPVRLAGVNWGGAHQDGLVPAGLDKLHRDEIAQRIVNFGLNHVRLTFALGTFVNKNGSPKTGSADAARLAANSDLGGLTPWAVYQAVTESLTAAGLAVVPNCQLMYPGWCCSDDDCNGLWYNGNWPASTFTSTWLMVAQRFAGHPLVIGYDLKNEPRPAMISGTKVTPTWGTGNTGAHPTDIQQLYSDTASQMRAADPAKLFFCEGLKYATDLKGAKAHPVTGSNVVYSMHDYPWFHPSGQSQADYFAAMDSNGGYLVTQGIAPLWIGEFGTDTRTVTTSDWMAHFQAWAQARSVHFCWWQLSAQAVKGTEPCTNKVKALDGAVETFGLMAGQDWLGSHSETIALLQAMTT